MHVLVLNVGSSSLKHQLVNTESGRRLRAGTVEGLGPDRPLDQALREVLAGLGDVRVDAVGHRVVHGGERFVDAARIDDEVEAGIEAQVRLAPLHNPGNLAGIRAARALLPGVPQVAVFDTAFHARLPRRARTVPIDRELADRHGLRRYGFHGTSHRFVAELAAAHLDRPLTELRLVTLHLGNGASACAIEFGHSVETSMGLTPLGGLVMGTRPGDLDPGVVLALVRAEGLDRADQLLNRQSGLLGMSGHSHDLRELEARAAAGDDPARLAIQVFAHRARQVIGAYAAVMGGLDAVVLTGGIGENGASMRRRILQRLDFLGLVLDDDRNDEARVNDDEPVAEISAEHARVRSLVVATDEELQIARETAAVVGASVTVGRRKPIPIAISARHVHLDRAGLDALFGAGSELTPVKALSQPGQFASDQRVSIVGPRGRIDGVRVLGPLRKGCQVEVSRTDEFLLGVDAPVRQSGHTKASAPITLEGPAGTLKLPEGLICAWRHIHMHPDDALAYGVVDGQEVEIAVTGGIRDVVFGDVIVRVHPQFALEMHVDTDEANAAELGPGGAGALLDEPYATARGNATIRD